MPYKKIKVPKKGSKISYKDGKIIVPDNPIVPFIEITKSCFLTKGRFDFEKNSSLTVLLLLP